MSTKPGALPCAQNVMGTFKNQVLNTIYIDLDQRWCFRDLAATEKGAHCHSRDSITHLLNERPSIVSENRTECGISPSSFKRNQVQERDLVLRRQRGRYDHNLLLWSIKGNIFGQQSKI